MFHPYIGGGEELVSRHLTLRGALRARQHRQTSLAYEPGIIGIYALGVGHIKVNGL